MLASSSSRPRPGGYNISKHWPAVPTIYARLQPTASGARIRRGKFCLCPDGTVILAGTESGYPNVNPLFLTHKSRNSIFSIPWYCKPSLLYNSKNSVLKSLGQSRTLPFQQNKFEVNSCHLRFQLKKSIQKIEQKKISGYVNIQVMQSLSSKDFFEWFSLFEVLIG